MINGVEYRTPQADSWVYRNLMIDMKLQNSEERMDPAVNGAWRVFILYHMQKSIQVDYRQI